ncbi:MAG: GFA family protein [Spongiibacteraceae bacterium]
MIEGECFCAAVKYQIDGVLKNARSCHCSRCRKVFSAAASAYAELESPQTFRWLSGENNVRRYNTQPDWGLGFCEKCGSTLCGFYKGGVHGVALGSVNGDPGIEISAHIFVASKAPWDHIGGEAKQYDEHQPGGQ